MHMRTAGFAGARAPADGRDSSEATALARERGFLRAQPYQEPEREQPQNVRIQGPTVAVSRDGLAKWSHVPVVSLLLSWRPPPRTLVLNSTSPYLGNWLTWLPHDLFGNPIAVSPVPCGKYWNWPVWLPP